MAGVGYASNKVGNVFITQGDPGPRTVLGRKNDNFRAIKRFKRTLDSKGYDVTYIKVWNGHNWKNWRPLLDDVLLTFF